MPHHLVPGSSALQLVHKLPFSLDCEEEEDEDEMTATPGDWTDACDDCCCCEEGGRDGMDPFVAPATAGFRLPSDADCCETEGCITDCEEEGDEDEEDDEAALLPALLL